MSRRRAALALVGLVALAALPACRTVGRDLYDPAANRSEIRILTQPRRTAVWSTPDLVTVERRQYRPSSDTGLLQHHLTQDGSDRYQLRAEQGAVRVTAPPTNLSTPEGSATRSVIWPPATAISTDQQTCATWGEAPGPWAQQGLALRIRRDGTRFRTIVVAKNTVFGAEWQFNVYTWDSARSPYLAVHGSVGLRAPFEALGVPRPLPWHVCAKVQGRIVRVKGWREAEPEPGWHDPSHAGAVTLPPEWVYPGKAGWYAGHVDPGRTLAMDDLETSALALVPERQDPGTDA